MEKIKRTVSPRGIQYNGRCYYCPQMDKFKYQTVEITPLDGCLSVWHRLSNTRFMAVPVRATPPTSHPNLFVTERQ